MCFYKYLSYHFQASIEQLVDFLKDDLMFVNVFVLTFKESDKRLTLGLQSMMKLLGTVLSYISINLKSINH